MKTKKKQIAKLSEYKGTVSDHIKGNDNDPYLIRKHKAALELIIKYGPAEDLAKKFKQ